MEWRIALNACMRLLPRCAGVQSGYVVARRGGRLVLEYVSGNHRDRYATCSAKYEPYIRLVARDLTDIANVMRTFIAMKILPFVGGREARAIDVIRDMDDFEALFWYIKLLNRGAKAAAAFRRLYLDP